jgi:hypothetical protein
MSMLINVPGISRAHSNDSFLETQLPWFSGTKISEIEKCTWGQQKIAAGNKKILHQSSVPDSVFQVICELLEKTA